MYKIKYVCLNDVTCSMAMKMRLKMKNRLHRYDINRPRPKHRHKYSKYKMRLNIMVVIVIKHKLSSIWSSIHEKVKQHQGWVEKKALLIKTSLKFIIKTSFQSQVLSHFLANKSSCWDLYYNYVFWKFQRNSRKIMINVWFSFFCKVADQNPQRSENAFFIYALLEILLKYQGKLIRYVRYFGTTILQNSSGGCFWMYSFPFWITLKSTT